MTLDEARDLLKEVSKNVNFINLGQSVYALADDGYTWLTFDNNKWRADKNLSLKDAQWLADHASELVTALQFMSTYRP